jgi:hypothetical protein
MFVARSAARVRFARLVFLLVGIAPVVGLVAWAVHLRSDSHRAAIEQRWQETLGIPLVVGAIEHPRPGVIRGRNCRLPTQDGRPPVLLPLIEIESSADEDRIRLGQFACDPTAAALLTELTRGWLADEVRFRRTCIVEVADFSWVGSAPSAPDETLEPGAPVRVECVARPGTRAVRLVRHVGQATDEVRIVRGTPTGPPAEGVRPNQAAGSQAAGSQAAGSQATGNEQPPPGLTVSADCQQPVPLAALVIATGGGLDAAAACGVAAVTGSLQASWDASGWSGSAQGRISGIDLAAAVAAVGGRASGVAHVDVTRLAWQSGRVTDALLECAVGSGLLDGRLFDRIVMALAARPGPAARPLAPGGERQFDAAACIVGVGPFGVQVMPTTRLPAGLAVSSGEVLLAPPQAAVPADRIAWMLSAPDTAYAPAQGPGSWLISVLPPAAVVPAAADGRF